MLERVTGNVGANLLTTETSRNSSQGSDFQEILKGAVMNVNQFQVEALRQMEALALGNVDDIHKPIIAAEKASLTLELLVQVRNKALDAYQEIMRMQI